MIRFVG